MPHGVVPAVPLQAPACVTAPYVAGTGTVGEVLTSTMGTWTGEPTSYSYVWQNELGSDLGTGSSYTVIPSDAGNSILCMVTATNAAGSAVSPPSNAVAIPVGSGPFS